MTDQSLALKALKRVDFDWAMHVKRVWQDANYDVDMLHQQEREKILNKLVMLKHSTGFESPLGIVIVGQAGSGKTHLLSAIRKYALVNALNFVLVDMTDVRDFWETVLQGYISSLQEAGLDGLPQLKFLIDHLITFTGKDVPASKLAQLPEISLKNAIKAILSGLAKHHQKKTLEYQDVIRALILLNSNDFAIAGIGYSWLQGLEIESEDKTCFSFTASSAVQLSRIVAGLSWAMNLAAPTVLAIDQLDAIVTQHHLAAGQSIGNELTDEQRLSKSIIEGIGGGLMALRDETCRTFTIVSCLQHTWKILRDDTVTSFRDRFEKDLVLKPIVKINVAQTIVQLRLGEAYRHDEFSPPYPTWPFSDQFFKEAGGQFPRRILQICNEHRDRCIAQGVITELDSITNGSISPLPPLSSKVDQEFAALQTQVELALILEEQNEDSQLGSLLQIACECLQIENSTPGNIDTIVEVNFPGGANYPVLHSRIRLVFRDENDREKHLCLRALQRSHAKAYQARLQAAMTASGIDRSLSFRRLAVVRTQELPGGAMTQKLTEKFQTSGGIFLHPMENELRQLGALQKLKQKQHPEFPQWLRDRRPVSQLPFMQEVTRWLFDGVTLPEAIPESPERGQNKQQSQNTHQDSTSSRHQLPIPDISGSSAATPTHQPQSSRVAPIPPHSQLPTVPQPRSTPLVASGLLPVGARLVGSQTREPVAIRLEDLTKHTVILAGSGSGKTVLIKRLVEEAALQGIPAIVIDGANDLSRMGDRWPHIPEGWSEEDQQRADLYHQSTEVVIWTPGREAGNPLNLEPLPNFGAIAHDPDELEQAIDMSRDSLQDIVAAGKSTTAKIKQGILRKALEYFATSGGGSLEDFALLLSDLPPDAVEGIAKAQKLAPEMSDLLMAEIVNNPLLRQSGSSLDPAILLGLGSATNKTRISVINLVGLVGLNTQQQFLNQLAMTLFTWIKKNPAPKGVPLRGLVVIDEAKDFVPSGSNTPCKASLSRLAAQARKYGLGLIFATQAPKSIDHNIIANCSTQFYGRSNSPAAIDVIRQQLMQRGGSSQDIAKLAKGQFYAVSEALSTPTKIQTPLCLSYHPSSPPDELEVLALAKASRKAIASNVGAR